MEIKLDSADCKIEGLFLIKCSEETEKQLQEIDSCKISVVEREGFTGSGKLDSRFYEKFSAIIEEHSLGPKLARITLKDKLVKFDTEEDFEIGKEIMAKLAGREEIDENPQRGIITNVSLVQSVDDDYYSINYDLDTDCIYVRLTDVYSADDDNNLVSVFEKMRNIFYGTLSDKWKEYIVRLENYD